MALLKEFTYTLLWSWAWTQAFPGDVYDETLIIPHLHKGNQADYGSYMWCIIDRTLKIDIDTVFWTKIYHHNGNLLFIYFFHRQYTSANYCHHTQ